MIRAPWWVAALAVLLVNDHVLKAAWPGPATGKLSDVAGLIVAPPLLALLLVPLSRHRDPGRVAVVLTGLGFAAIQVVPAATALADAVWDVVLPSTVTPDPSDLWALPALLVPWRSLSGRRPPARRTVAVTHRRSPADRALVLLGAVACLATSGEPAPRVALVATRDGVIVAENGTYRGWYELDEASGRWVPTEECGEAVCASGTRTPCGGLGCLVIHDDTVAVVEGDEERVVHTVSPRLHRLEERFNDWGDGSGVVLGVGVVTDDRAIVAAGSAGVLVSSDLGSWSYAPVGTVQPATREWPFAVAPELALVIAAAGTAIGLRFAARPDPDIHGVEYLHPVLVVLAPLVVGAFGALLAELLSVYALVVAAGSIPAAYLLASAPGVASRSPAWRRRVLLDASVGVVCGTAVVAAAGLLLLPLGIAAAGWVITLGVGLLLGAVPVHESGHPTVSPR